MVNVASGEPALLQNLCANAWRLHSYPQWKDHPLRLERGFKTSLPAHSFPGPSDTVCSSSDCATLSGTIGPAGFSCQSSFWGPYPCVRYNILRETSSISSSHCGKIVQFITNRGWANNELRCLNLLLWLLLLFFFCKVTKGQGYQGTFQSLHTVKLSWGSQSVSLQMDNFKKNLNCGYY